MLVVEHCVSNLDVVRFAPIITYYVYGQTAKTIHQTWWLMAAAEWSEVLLVREKMNENQKDLRPWYLSQ